jgi:hypothetical protein
MCRAYYVPQTMVRVPDEARQVYRVSVSEAVTNLNDSVTEEDSRQRNTLCWKWHEQRGGKGRQMINWLKKEEIKRETNL